MTRILIAAVFVLVMTAAASAERRVALVFGIDRYETLRPLGNAVNDAQAIDRTLSALGFEVFLESNRDLRRMRRALEDFQADAAGADVALVFFAGHGVEISGDNRLLPSDADGSSLASLRQSSLGLEEVRAAIAATGRIGLIVLDACRNDPFGTAGGDGRAATVLTPEIAEKVRPGLGRMGRAENVLFAFSAAPGETAADGAGANSPFTAALAKYLGSDGLDIRSVLTLVQQEVYDTSRGNQLPYVESGLPKFFFAATSESELPERERLLLAMAEVTDGLRREVEQVASTHGMPLAPLYGALIEARLGALSDTDRRKKLTEAAKSYRDAEARLKTLSSSDPQITRLRTEAEAKLKLGAFAEARARLAEAAEIDARSGDMLAGNLVARRISEAETHVAAAGVARTQLDHQGALKSMEAAATLYARIENEEVPDRARRERDWLLAGIGDLYVLTGNVAKALGAYERMFEAARMRIAKSPGLADAERDLAASYERIGDARVSQGDLRAALDAHEASLAIRARLAPSDPGNAKWQRDLSISHSKIGDVRMSQGNLKGALESYEAALGISLKLVSIDPGNTEFQRDLLVGHSKIGDVREAQGNLQGALEAYQASLDIMRKLASTDPGNTGWQRDLSVGHERIGDVRVAQGNLKGALEAYEAGLAIRRRLAASDPGNAQWQRDLSIGHNNIGDVRKEQGDLRAALEAYEAGLAIRQGLAASDPGNAGWQLDLSVSHNNIGAVLRAQGNLVAALEAYEAGLAIRLRFAASDPGNARWQRDLSISYNQIGNARIAQGNLKGALEAYEADLAISQRLAASDPGNAQGQIDLSISHSTIGDVRKAQGDLKGALEAYEAGLAISQRLAASDPSNAQWQRVLAYISERMGEVRKGLAAGTQP